MQNNLKILQKTLTAFAIIIILLGFTEPANLVTGNWYQQFMPNMNGAQITDITFTDSLNGYAVTSLRGANDSAFIFKTTNGGDNWTLKFSNNYGFIKVKFLNANTGFTNAFTTIFKTTNSGQNWSPINLPGIFGDDMYVLNQDTIWLAMSESLTGGVYRTTNGGTSWTQQLFLGNQNPSKIYMYSARIGFVSSTAGLYKTTNSGINWFNASNDFSFSDMYFIDSLSGWKAAGSMKQTTNGGLNWVNQILPQGGMINVTQMIKFFNINKDTIWGVGGRIGYPNNQLRGILYRTTNGGANWLFQVPDTSINIGQYNFIKFINKINGWAYSNGPGIHTSNGGDTTFLTGMQEISNNIPKEYKLYQNYPNPFNPVTIIKYQLKINSYVKLSVFDITGKHILDLVNQEQTPGTYNIDFSGKSLSSGVYFYSLIIDGILIDTKKMILIK